MIDNSTINTIKQQKQFWYKFLSNKSIKYLYWIIPIIILLIFLIIGVTLASINKDLFIIGMVFIGLAFVVIIAMFFLSYFEKKYMNKIKECFSFDKLVSYPLWYKKITANELATTEIFNREYLNYFHHSISNTKDLKWHTKTFATNSYHHNNPFLLRASYIIDFGDKQRFLLKSKKITQLYLQTDIDISQKIIISNQKLNHIKKMTHKQIDCYHFYFEKEIDDKKIKKVNRFLNALNSQNIDFDIIIENDKLNIFWLKQNNYLSINFENKKYDEQSLINEIEMFCKLINEIIN